MGVILKTTKRNSSSGETLQIDPLTIGTTKYSYKYPIDLPELEKISESLLVSLYLKFINNDYV